MSGSRLAGALRPSSLRLVVCQRLSSPSLTRMSRLTSSCRCGLSMLSPRSEVCGSDGPLCSQFGRHVGVLKDHKDALLASRFDVVLDVPTTWCSSWTALLQRAPELPSLPLQ